MRLGEITNLTWANVDLSRKEIHVRNSAEAGLKGGRPRVIPMNGWVYSFLTSILSRGQYVFENRRAQPFSCGSISHRFKKYLRRAGLADDLHFHSLRRTGISWLINRGVPATFVQRIAGHSSLMITDRVYTHLEDKTLLTAVNAFPVLN